MESSRLGHIAKYQINMRKINLIVAGLLFTTMSFAQVKDNSSSNAILHTTSGDIFGTLTIPATSTEAVPVVLLIAGSGPTDRNGNQPQIQNNSLKMLCEMLLNNGIASLSFDKRGIAESHGNMKSEADLSFDDYVNDVCGWIDLLAKDERFSEIIIAGHSEGSLIGMIAAQNSKNVSKYISISGFGEPAAEILKDQLSKQLEGDIKDLVFSYLDMLEKGETINDVPPLLYSLFRPSIQPYMISWLKYNPQEEIKKLEIPTLIIQGTTDIQVSIEQAELLAEAQPRAQKVIIEDMNHVLKDCAETDMNNQLMTYNNPNLPINKELERHIVGFIKKR